MNRILCTCLLVLGIVLSWTPPVCEGEFFVIPAGKKATGDAARGDVLAGKTFSNATGTGLVGTRPPATLVHPYGVSWPEPRFTEGTHIVTDHLTGLKWQKARSTEEMDHNHAVLYCSDLVVYEPAGEFVVIYDDWQLPNVNQLLSLVDWREHGPALPEDLPLEGMDVYLYWSGTKQPGLIAWVVEFWTGGALRIMDWNAVHARCVHDDD